MVQFTAHAVIYGNFIHTTYIQPKEFVYHFKTSRPNPENLINRYTEEWLDNTGDTFDWHQDKLKNATHMCVYIYDTTPGKDKRKHYTFKFDDLEDTEPILTETTTLHYKIGPHANTGRNTTADSTGKN